MAPKRAFGGVLRPFGGGFRGPNRERASVFSGAGRGRAGGSAVEPGRDQRVQRRGTGRCRWFCGGARRRSQRVQRRGIGAGRGVQRCRRDGPAAGREGGGMASRPPPRPLPKAAAGCKADGRAAGSQKSVPKGRCARRQDAKKVFRGEGAPPPEHIRAQKKRTSVRSLLFLLLYGLLLRDARPIHPAARQRLRTPGARLFCGRLPAACSPATACLPSISVCPSVGVTAVKASAIRSLSRSAARRSGLSRLAAGISAVRVAPRESLRPPPGVTVLSRRGHSSQPSGVSAVRSPELAVPAARPLRRRGHSTTTSVWPSTCNWRISCVELT